MTDRFKEALDAIPNRYGEGDIGLKKFPIYWFDKFYEEIMQALRIAQELQRKKAFEASLAGRSISELTDALRSDGRGIALDDAFREIYRHLAKRLSEESEQLRKERDDLARAVVDLGKHLEPEFHYQMRFKNIETIKFAASIVSEKETTQK